MHTNCKRRLRTRQVERQGFKVINVGIIRSFHFAGGYSLNAWATPLLTISKFFSKLSPTVSLITARHTNFFSDDSARFTTKVAS